MNAKVLSLANDSVIPYLKHFSVMGIEMEENSSWFYAVGRYENSQRVDVLSVAKKDSGANTTHFWDLDCFAIIFAMRICGYKLLWTTKGYPMWPVWYLNSSEMQKFSVAYETILLKYGFDRKSIGKNRFA